MTQTAITKRLRDWGKAVRTTAFKFSLLFTLASSFVTGISMYTLYRSAEKEIREQIDSRLLAETTSLRRRFEERTSIGLYTPVLGIIERVPGDPNITFCVTAKSPPSGSNGLPFTNRNNNAPATIDTSAADQVFERLAGKQVRDLLGHDRRQLAVLTVDDTSMEAAALMADTDSPLVAITDQGRYVGAVTVSGLLRAVTVA